MESSFWCARGLHNSSALNSDLVYQLRRLTVPLVPELNPTSQRAEPNPEEALTNDTVSDLGVNSTINTRFEGSAWEARPLRILKPLGSHVFNPK